jgi:hypothetical protein
MRASCVTFILGIGVACSGEPFSAATRIESGGVPTHTTAGTGGSQPAPSTEIEPAAAGSAVAQGGRRDGNTSSPGGSQPESGGGIASIGGDAGVGGEQAGGEGGASSAPGCPSRATGDWELGYFPELRVATTQESHPFFRIMNRGEPTTLDRIVIRYYFTKESDMAETASCYWVTGDHCSLAKLAFHDVPAPTASASRYLEISFPGASTVTVAGGSLEVRVAFKTGSDVLLQTNDYSFDPDAAAADGAAPLPYKRWLQATLYKDGDLVWGTEPCAVNGAARPQ